MANFSYPFQLLEVAVLPAGLTPLDLKKIEFQLQMKQETKLQYDWVIQCVSVKDLSDRGMSHQEIMQSARLTRVEEVQAMISRLNEADLYLSEYLGTPQEYAAVERQEQQFSELQRALARKTDVGEKELARRMCYVITKHSRSLDTRAYDFKLAFGSKTKEVAERLAAHLEIDLPDPPPADDADDLFADEAAGAMSVKFEPLRRVLADGSKSEELAEAIADVCTEIKEESDGEADAKKPLRDAKRARVILSKIEVQRAAESTLNDLRAELQEIIEIGHVKLPERALPRHDDAVQRAQIGRPNEG